MATPRASQRDPARELDEILHELPGLGTAFQPIVDLLTGAVVAYEGLTRGPLGSSLQLPEDLFAAARGADRLEELDWLCRVAALRRALAIGIRPPLTLFLNVEPEVLTEPPEHAGPVLARATGGLRVVVELTERALLDAPSALLRYVESVRHRGWGVAVDDVGAHPHSLAVLSVVEPDIVKIDQSALRAMPRTEATAVISGVQTYCRRSGAQVVAEGLETEDDVAIARSLGAHFGQGFLFGHPVPLTSAPTPTSGPVPMINPRPHLPTRRLINMLTKVEPPVHGDRARIDTVTSTLLTHAGQMGSHTMVLVCVQDAAFLTEPLRAVLADLAGSTAHVAVLGADVPPEPVPGAQGTALQVGDPLVSEWVVVMLGLQESITLVASDAGDEHEAGAARRYEYAVTYDPQLVTDVARALLSRVA